MARGLARLWALTFLLGCDSTPPPSDRCSEPPSYMRDLLPGVVSRTCLGCHSVNAVGSDRNQAPLGMNYDSYASFTSTQAKADFANDITAGRMPPPGDPHSMPTSIDERNMVELWRACGYPP